MYQIHNQVKTFRKQEWQKEKGTIMKWWFFLIFIMTYKLINYPNETKQKHHNECLRMNSWVGLIHPQGLLEKPEHFALHKNTDPKACHTTC